MDFRERLIRTDMDRRLLERTVELARQTEAFDWKKLPKNLRVAIDSSPLEGAGRVEDTINLLGHAAKQDGDEMRVSGLCQTMGSVSPLATQPKGSSARWRPVPVRPGVKCQAQPTHNPRAQVGSHRSYFGCPVQRL